MFEKGIFGGLEQAAQFSRVRHRAISQNIANVDTPFYKAKRASVSDFQDVMSEAFEEMENRKVRVFSLDHDQDLVNNPESELGRLSDADPQNTGILKHDGNNVNVDQEMARLAKNQIFHTQVMDLLRHKFNLVEQAITEEPGR